MALTFTPGTPVGTAGEVTSTTLDVATPTLGANDTHVMVVGVSSSAPTLATPAGYTSKVDHALTTSGGSPSSSGRMYVFTRQGAAASGTITLTLSVAGKMAVAHGIVASTNAATPVEAATGANYLTAPSQTATSATMLMTCYVVRNSSTDTVGNPFSITQAAGFTEGTEAISSVANNDRQTAAEISYKTISAGATGTAAATTDAISGFNAAAASLTFIEGTPAATAPDAPVITVASGDTQATVSWAAPYNGGSALTGYTLQRRTYTGGTPGSWSTVYSPASGATSRVDTGLTNGTTYGYQLLATNAIGSSAYSAEVTVVPAVPSSSGYLAVIMATSPDHYYPLNSTYTTQDLGKATSKIVPTNVGSVVFDSTTVNGTSIDSARFSGSNYLEFANSIDWSVTKTKELTIMAFLTVDDYETFSNGELTHWLGKGKTYTGGSASKQEWVGRFYTTDGGPQQRPRRHSCYYFGYPLPSNANGCGSYCQPNLTNVIPAEVNLDLGGGSTERDDLAPGQEHVMVFQFYTTGTGTYPGGTKIYLNGRLVDADLFSGYNLIPGWFDEAMRLGRREADSSIGGSLKGRVRRLAFWNRLLTQTEITALTSPTNQALTEGVIGSTPVATPPTQPLNVVATRAGSTAAGTVTWSVPLSDGGAAITGYVVTHDNGGIGSPVVSDLLSTSTFFYQLVSLPNLPINVSVIARNSAGDSSAGTAVIAPFVAVPAVSSIVDSFDNTPDPRRFFGPGVVQRNGHIEWDIVDDAPRETYIEGDMTGQSAWMMVLPSRNPNTIGCFFVRSAVDPTQQFRIAVLNGAIIARYSDSTGPIASASRPFNPDVDIYWKVATSNGYVLLQTSPDASTWTTVTGWPPGVAEPAWFLDVRVGVEQYTAAELI